MLNSVSFAKVLVPQSSAGLWNSLYDDCMEQSIQRRGQEGQMRMVEVLVQDCTRYVLRTCEMVFTLTIE